MGIINNPLKTNPIGLYIHIPFCVRKCPYCDFYSITESGLMEDYVDSLTQSLRKWGKQLNHTAVDTLYLGGGTPSLLSSHQLAHILSTAKSTFNFTPDAEITIEVNPGDNLDLLYEFVKNGGNRVSIGMQSSVDSQLKLLGRRHNFDDTIKAVKIVKSAGISNFSLDIILATEDQTKEDIRFSVEQAVNLGATHISVYLLQIEEGTPFFQNQFRMNLPDEDVQAELYLYTCELLEDAGFKQYEISNFCKNGFESRHNLKYWLGQDYLGIGPSAHSFLDGKRFFYSDNIAEFISGAAPIFDDDPSIFEVGSMEEYIMLALRLSKGVIESVFLERYGINIPEIYRKSAMKLPSNLIISDSDGIRLSREGFLLSNYVISRILGD